MERRNSAPSIRVVQVDDQALEREGPRLLLESMPGVQVVAERATGEELLRQPEGDRPDLLRACQTAARVPAQLAGKGAVT